MSILTDKTILKEIEKGNIKIQQFNRENLGTNSYDKKESTQNSNEGKATKESK